jgi:hypothetical protein
MGGWVSWRRESERVHGGRKRERERERERKVFDIARALASTRLCTRGFPCFGVNLSHPLSFCCFFVAFLLLLLLLLLFVAFVVFVALSSKNTVTMKTSEGF